MEPIIDHIQITVKDMGIAVPFYDRFLPLLGFNIQNKGSAVIKEHECHVVEYAHPRLIFAITSPRSAFAGDTINRRKPGALHHLAFKAEFRAEVDRLHSELKGIGATIVSPPREYPEYTPPGYYALFFKDLEGIKYEIVCTKHDGRIEMKPAKVTSSKSADAERQLKSFIAKFDPAHQTLIRAVRRTLRRRFPTAYEMAYDNYNFFVIGYGPTERPSECIVSMAAGANGVGLCFIRGASLPDPKKLLLGSGNQTRFIRLESADVLGRPEVETLIAAAVVQAKTPFRAGERGKLIIRSVSKKQRPRRKVPK